MENNRRGTRGSGKRGERRSSAHRGRGDRVVALVLANVSAAKANLRVAVPGMEAFNADHATGYTGVARTKLQQSYDSGIKNIKIVRSTSANYCVQKISPGTATYHRGGHSGKIVSGIC